MSRISVLLPVYNGERYLQRSIESLLAQNDPRWTLLVRDDGSTDRTPEILRQFEDSRIHVLSSDGNLGLFGNLNTLLDHATTPLVRFFCQDDLLDPDCIGREIQFFDEHPEIGMSFCKLRSINAAGRVVDEGPIGDIPEIVDAPKSLLMLYYWGCLPANLSTVCVRRRCMEALGGFDETYDVAGDYDLWARLCRRWPMGVIHEHLAEVRTHDEQLSQASASGVAFVREDRRVRSDELLPYLPAEVRGYARMHERLRQNVKHTHQAMRRLSAGNVEDALRIWRIQGWVDALVGLVAWFLTLNNRLYTPPPKFSLNDQ
jgi:glycosyltransferase involved in cell wall biosynthesis